METHIQSLLSRPAVQAHLVGALGAGMQALSQFLADLGWLLTGSDLQPATRSDAGSANQVALQTRQPELGVNQLADRFIHFHQGHHFGHVPTDAKLLIYSPAIHESNPERQQAARLGIPQLAYHEFLAELSKAHQTFCVAGTHGKTTTSAMLATIFREARIPSSAIVGGELQHYSRSGWTTCGDDASDKSLTSKRLLVLESCEYRRHFLQLAPTTAVVLNIEPDHFDCFSSIDDAERAYHEFVRRVPANGRVLLNGDSPATLNLADSCRASCETFGFGSSNRWSAKRVGNRTSDTTMIVTNDGQPFCAIQLPVAGRHNVLNALAAVALGAHAGLEAAQIQAGFTRYRGVRRRFELVGSRDGVTVITDYAHHPTAIRATIETAREVYPNRRVVCVFEPHQVSRTIELMDEFTDALSLAEDITLTPIFAAREDRSDATSVLERLVGRISDRKRSVRSLETLDHVNSTLDHVVQHGDVLLFLGAGSIEDSARRFLTASRSKVPLW